LSAELSTILKSPPEVRSIFAALRQTNTQHGPTLTPKPSETDPSTRHGEMSRKGRAS
jgi:hypothetical protein